MHSRGLYYELGLVWRGVAERGAGKREARRARQSGGHWRGGARAAPGAWRRLRPAANGARSARRPRPPAATPRARSPQSVVRVFSTLLRQLHESFPLFGFSVPNQNCWVPLGRNADAALCWLVYAVPLWDDGCWMFFFYFSTVADLCLTRITVTFLLKETSLLEMNIFCLENKCWDLFSAHASPLHCRARR